MGNEPGEARALTLRPIGYVRTASRLKFDAPRQPDMGSGEVNQIELLPGHQFELALQDLATFDRIWLLWWFDRNQTWRPRVLPPRGPAHRRGVFATRSPHRPNPLGLTCVTLHAVHGRVLEVGPLDLTDGTPILDIKPYLRTVDAHPESGLGWLEEIEQEEAQPPPFAVVVEPLAERQLAWLRQEGGIDFTERAFAILRRDPTPHRTRRILQVGPNRYRIACGSWRMFYRLDAATVKIEEVASGHSTDALGASGREASFDPEAHAAFRLLWPT
ncbi:MAG: tRNA (N6-threonylcarbamoyladenosine(37)-N6)-methyltransferase TrmO [Fimbriimonas sp.]